jgi:hypothetical protein
MSREDTWTPDPVKEAIKSRLRARDGHDNHSQPKDRDGLDKYDYMSIEGLLDELTRTGNEHGYR